MTKFWKFLSGRQNILDHFKNLNFFKIKNQLSKKMGKGCPPKPPSYVRAGDWFRHVGQDGAWMWPTPTRTPEVEGDEDEDQTEEDKLKLPPIFQFRSRKNYRVERWEGIHLFRNVFQISAHSLIGLF